MNDNNTPPDGFSSPTELPDDRESVEWQEQNRSWWEDHPMRYDWNEEIGAAEFSQKFFQEIDKRFFSDSARYMPPKNRPFDAIVPFDALGEMDVLEIGVGNGSHAQLLAQECKSYTGIDLTAYAVSSTKKRFEIFDIAETIKQMDAEKLDFPSESFDYIWTWGVIHHSANTSKILKEMNRVLRPGGKATIMVYHRSFLYYYIFNGLFRGILCGGFSATRSLHKLVQISTDGAIARFYSPKEWTQEVDRCGFSVDDLQVRGQKSELFPLPASSFKDRLMALLPNAISRFFLNTCRQGSFLITTISKR